MKTIWKGTKEHKPAIFSVAFGLTVFAVGWCVMLIFWNCYGRPESHGFTFFVSFLFGDSLFLPILAGALLAYIKLPMRLPSAQKRPTLAQERCAWIAALISALAGTFIQGSWLLSDQTELNWTIPKLHEFNGAGWWHAGFFVFMFATVGYLSIRFMIARFLNALDGEAVFDDGSNKSISRFRKKIAGRPATDTTPRRFAMYLIWFGASGYSYLRQQEGLNVDFVDWKLLVMIPGAALVGWLVSSLLSGRRPTVDDVRLTLAGALSAYGIVEVCVGLLYGTVVAWEIQIAISFALLATRLVPICPSDRHITITTEIMVGLSAFGVILTYLRTPIIMQAPAIALAIGVLSLLVLVFITDTRGLLHKACASVFQKRYMKKIVYLWSPCLLLSMMLFGLALMSESNLSVVRDMLLTAVLSSGIASGIGLFNAFAKFAEEEKGPNDILIGKNAAYVRIMLMLIGLLMISILFVGQAALGFSHTFKWGLLLILPFSGACVALYAIPGRKLVQTDDTDGIDSVGHIQPRVAVLLIILALAYILLFFLIYGLREPVYASGWDILLIFPIVGSTFFVANGIIQNGRLLCGIPLDDVKKDRALHIAIVEVVIGCFFVFPLAILPSRQSDSIAFSTLSPLIGILGLYLSSCTLPRFAARAVGCPLRGSVINDAGFAGVKQDTWNSFMMISIAGLFVIHLVEWQLLRGNILVVIATLVGFVISAGVLIRFTLENNSRHYLKQYVNGVFKILQNQGKDNANEQRALKKHLEHQAHLVLIALFPYSSSCLLWPLFAGQFEEIEEIPFVVAVYNNYLLRLPGLQKYAENQRYIKCFKPGLLPMSYHDKKNGGKPTTSRTT